jgi:sigma-E factor negative regulatory protein RseC
MMPEEIGTVIKKTGSTATVRIPRTSMCTGCHNCILSQDGTAMTVTARDTLQTKIGDRVKIEERQSGRIKAGFLLLILPLLAFIPGYMAGAAISNLTGVLSRQTLGVLIGLVTFSTPWLVLFLLNRHRAGKRTYQMHIVSILKRNK